MKRILVKSMLSWVKLCKLELQASEGTGKMGGDEMGGDDETGGDEMGGDVMRWTVVMMRIQIF